MSKAIELLDAVRGFPLHKDTKIIQLERQGLEELVAAAEATGEKKAIELARKCGFVITDDFQSEVTPEYLEAFYAAAQQELRNRLEIVLQDASTMAAAGKRLDAENALLKKLLSQSRGAFGIAVGELRDHHPDHPAMKQILDAIAAIEKEGIK